MTAEPQRLQYLEAMGLTAWVPRFVLPNARESEACDWSPTPPPAARPPGERLHALLDEAEHQPARQRTPAPPPREPRTPPGAGRARQLLGGNVPPADAPTQRAESSEAAEPRPADEPLRFSLQVACLDGRWLLLLPGNRPPQAVALRLLGNLLRAAGVEVRQPPAFEAFGWPLEEGLPVYAPLEEARQGLQAFVEGASRRGWVPERVLLFGHDETLERLLNIENSRCELLGIPGWQGPSLEALAGSAEAKRTLWPTLAGWRDAWNDGVTETGRVPDGHTTDGSGDE